MFKKNKKQTENIKEKKVRTVKVGTHQKTVIALWAVLIASVSFGAYKNFTAIDQHTTHEKEIIELRLQDTNGIENFVKNFAKSYYTWSNSKEAIEARTQAINSYLTKELQDLNVDTIRTDILTSSTVTDVLVWNIEQSGTDTFSATYEVDQQIKEGEQTSNVKATYTVKVHVDADGDMVIVRQRQRRCRSMSLCYIRIVTGRLQGKQKGLRHTMYAPQAVFTYKLFSCYNFYKSFCTIDFS